MNSKTLMLALCGFLLTQTAANAWTVTASGAVQSGSSGGIDIAGLFGAPGGSLVGLDYTLSITSDPVLNTGDVYSSTSSSGTVGGSYYGAGTASPFTLRVTVGGAAFAFSEAAPYFNHSYLIDALSVGDTATTLQDQVYQGVDSGGCYSSQLACTSAYALAYSTETPFVPTLDFDQAVVVSSQLSAGSNAYFAYRAAGGPTTYFYGSIESFRIYPAGTVPEPGTQALVIAGLVALAFRQRRHKPTPAVDLA